MGDKIKAGEDAQKVFVLDDQNHRGLAVNLSRYRSDAELPTVDEVLRKVGLDPSLTYPSKPAKPDWQAEDRTYYAWDGGENLIRNLGRKVVRGENIRWGIALNNAVMS